MSFLIAFTLFILIERFFADSKYNFLRRFYFKQDLVYTLCNQLTATALGGYFIFLMGGPKPLAWPGHGFAGSLPLPLQLGLALLIKDLASYFIHRAFHSKWLWPFHQVHHQSEPVDWLSSYRFHPVNFVAYIFRIPLLFALGFNGKSIITIFALTEFYAFFVHLNINLRLGILRFIFVSPINHRFHHEKAMKPGNSNFATIFSFWDLLFGTYYDSPTKPIDPGVSSPTEKTLAGQLVKPFNEIRNMISKRKK